MEKIVTEPIKVDLHIHSCHSEHRESDGLTSNCTIDNLSVLVEKLSKRHIDMVSITDHDVFSYDLYKELKEKEKDGTFKKVLPGVEFSVFIKDQDDNDWPVHVIAIFDDSCEEKIKHIETVLGDGIKVKPCYNRGDRYDEGKLIELLNQIDLDTVFIAHQKQTLTSRSDPKPNDVNGIGKKKFNEYLFSEFFQALEFHDKKNELFNIKAQNALSDDLMRFITGSDCHDWDVYPNHDNSVDEEENFKFTYLKCLPTFRGLALALTDSSRIGLSPSFFSVSKNFIPNIKMSINGKQIDIPLSRGINAIIGDNSIGKSLILHKITNYYRETERPETSVYAITKGLKNKYESYLEKKSISVDTIVEQNIIYEFDTQGEIRRKITDNKLTDSDFIKKRAPTNPNIELVNGKVKEYTKHYFAYLKQISETEEKKARLKESKIVLRPEKLEATVLKICISELTEFTNQKSQIVNKKTKIESAIKSLKDVLELIREDEQQAIQETIALLDNVLTRYLSSEKQIQNTIDVLSLINSSFTEYEDNQTEITDDDKAIILYSNSKESFSSSIIDYLLVKDKCNDFNYPSIGEPINIKSEKLEYDVYKIVNCSNIAVVDDDYLLNLFKEPLNKDTFKRDTFVSKASLKNALTRCKESESNVWQYYENKVNEKIDFDLSSVCKINMLTDDDREDKSQGFGQKMYFKVICSDTKNEGVYLIDQPEDDVSQKSIKKELIGNLRKMGKTRQVILITHNPQFVVNLDVDNVIYFYENDEKEIKVESGALEYKNDETKEDILKNVAETLDGGVMTIRKRWKRYEKNIEDIAG